MMKNPVFFILLLPLFLCPFLVQAQETYDFFIPGPQRPSLAPEYPEEIPRQFRELFLGMNLDELKRALQRDGIFAFRGDRDVSIIPIREETLVETTGISFIRRAFFQLTGGSVFIMAFSLDLQYLDHYSVYTSLVKKYGEPDFLNPAEAVWESEETRLSIERPLTVKYIDKTVFDRLVEESRAQQSQQYLRREDFLNDF